MRKIKFLHFADLHLDAPFASLKAESGVSSARRQDLRDALTRIFDLSRSESADFILIAGDLYEHEYVRKSTINLIDSQFRSVPDTCIVITPGNHDPYTADSWYANYGWSPNVRILTPEQPFALLDECGVMVHGAGFTGFYEDESLLRHIRPKAPGYCNILLIHGTIGIEADKRLNFMPKASLSALGMDYIALGHFHNFSERPGGLDNAVYPGSPEPLGFDEPGDHGVLLCKMVSQDAAGMKYCVGTEFVKLNKRGCMTGHIPVDGFVSDEDAAGAISAFLQSKASSGASGCFRENIIRIVLTGYADKDYRPDKAAIIRAVRDQAFHIRLDSDVRNGFDMDEEARGPGLKGVFAGKMAALIGAARDEREKKLLCDAFRLGMEALLYGRVDPCG